MIDASKKAEHYLKLALRARDSDMRDALLQIANEWLAIQFEAAQQPQSQVAQGTKPENNKKH